jgi:hypothetical protein
VDASESASSGLLSPSISLRNVERLVLP